jgi:hypothetical protein
MKRKCENRELTGTKANVRRITRSMRRQKVLKTRTIYTGRKLRSSRVDIMDLPPEVMLQIFSHLSVTDVCQRVAPVCKKWSILARHPSLRKELSFGKGISKSNVRKLLHESPLLRRLRLKGRRDTDAILRKVCRSNRHIETLEMDGCRGSMGRYHVNGEILTRIVEGFPKLYHLCLKAMLVKRCNLHRLFARLDDRLESSKNQKRDNRGYVTLPANMCWTSQRTRRTPESIRRGDRTNVTDTAIKP